MTLLARRTVVTAGLVAMPAAALLWPPTAWGRQRPEPPFFVTPGPDGRLVYEADARGNRVPDFSHAGYGGGGVPIPKVAARVTVAPVGGGGDDGARLQAALDYVAGLPIDPQGFRGAVLLSRGRFHVAGNLVLRTSGVVLRGQGTGTDGTVLVATGNGRRTLIELRGAGGPVDSRGPARPIAEEYVPVGARTLALDDATGLKPGDAVLVRRPSPKQWLEAVGMVSVPGRPAPTWAADRMDVTWERRITAVEGRRVTLDAPLTCALEAAFGCGSVAAYAASPGRVRRVGVENLRCESAWNRANPADEEHAWMAVTLDNVEDAWVCGVIAAHFASTAVGLWETCRRVTVADCASVAPVSEVGGYRRHSFYTAGQQTLFLRCRAEGGRHDFAAGWTAAGPNAFVRCEAVGAHDFSGPIESWATGVLYDNVTMDGGGLRFDNREMWDNGVGWAAANCLLWQCVAPVIVARTPPGAQNWVVGCWAQFAGDARWRASNEFVEPQSLYAAQLAERVGKDAADAALRKREVSVGAAGVPRLESVPPAKPSPVAAAVPRRELRLRNGWLMAGDRVLAGGWCGIGWWRGRAQPSRAAEFGASVTRFVPGRVGPGLTDDLDALTDDMAAQGDAGLRHHWGLWYDRRREDHEMVRRADGDVWPPFFEQPWARSGQGRAWDGLSRYDLTRFNPWYFARLREFAAQCARKGLLLVNAMYFQHNVLEAGAHWADFPWRPGNCLQETGFPEPPPYAGGKRVFLAQAFYDVTHPVRRALHRAYIRQCLDNLAGETNVLHVLGEEYSGPLSFAQFWLDTVAEWRAEKGAKVLVGLSAPKDVQDALLADATYAARIDAIDFKYWWRSGEQEFAPKGGQDLAPRQHERLWKGGRPGDADLARMAAEYRARFPGKAVLCDFEQAGWAFLCAGGSLPNLPRTTDPALLAAAARMRPWPEASTRDRWALREPGRGCLVYSARGAGEVALDLTGESGSAFDVRLVDAKTGATAPCEGCRRVTAGGPVTLPKPSADHAVFWLTREGDSA